MVVVDVTTTAYVDHRAVKAVCLAVALPTSPPTHGLYTLFDSLAHIMAQLEKDLQGTKS